MLPTFIVIGAKKSGTTSLFEYLRAHPHVWLPDDKRLEFFTDENWGRGVDWYEAQFRGAGDHAARGEITTSYTRFPLVHDVAARMHGVVPDVRLLYLLRDPIARIVSHYRYAWVEGWERRTIDEAVMANSAEFVAPSRYAMQLAPFLEHFEREQILLFTSEDLRDDQATTMAKVYAFIGVDDTSAAGADADARRYHQGSDLRRAATPIQKLRASGVYRRIRPALPRRWRERAWTMTTRVPEIDAEQLTLSPETRAHLLERIRPDLVRLREIMGADFHCWGHLDP